MARTEKRNKNLEDLKKAVDLIDDNKKCFAVNLLKRVEFMGETLDSLEKQIKKEGAVITSTNGNGFNVTNEHPAQKSYNVMIGKYNAMVKTIIDMIPDGSKEGDELLEFIRRDSR